MPLNGSGSFYTRLSWPITHSVQVSAARLTDTIRYR